MARKKVHESNAARQKAWRVRQAPQRQKARENKPKRIFYTVSTLHTRVWNAANRGDIMAMRVLGDTPSDTLKKLIDHFEDAGTLSEYDLCHL